MSMSVGGVSFPLSVIELEQRIAVLEAAIEYLGKHSTINAGAPPFDVNAVRGQALRDLQIKYPDLGIQG